MSQGKWSGAGFVVLMVAALAAPSGGNAATIRHDVADSNYTNLSALPGFAASGFISIDQDPTPGGAFAIGSGTLVASNWVLTAAHVVTRNVSGSQVAWPTGQITFGQGATRPGSLVGSFGVAEVVIADGWNGNLEAGNDIALIRLTSNVTGVSPAPLYSLALLPSELGQNATIVGYQGRTGTGLTGNTTNNLARRAEANVIDAFGGVNTLGQTTNGTNVLYGFSDTNSRIMLTDFDSPDNNNDGTADGDPSDQYNIMGSGDPTALEGAQVPGDSGGGVFINIGGDEYLAGVTSFIGRFNNSPFAGQSADGFYGDFNGYTRVSQHLEFIITTIPEPAGMMAVLFVGLLLRRRRP